MAYCSFDIYLYKKKSIYRLVRLGFLLNFKYLYNLEKIINRFFSTFKTMKLCRKIFCRKPSLNRLGDIFKHNILKLTIN